MNLCKHPKNLLLIKILVVQFRKEYNIKIRIFENAYHL